MPDFIKLPYSLRSQGDYIFTLLNISSSIPRNVIIACYYHQTIQMVGVFCKSRYFRDQASFYQIPNFCINIFCQISCENFSNRNNFLSQRLSKLGSPQMINTFILFSGHFYTFFRQLFSVHLFGQLFLIHLFWYTFL